MQNNQKDISVRIKNKVVYFEKKIGLKGPDVPHDYESLKEEIKLWPRLGMGAGQKKILKTGFLRTHEFNHMYKDVEKDVDRLIEEGYLIEFKDNDHLHQLIKIKNSNSNRREGQRISTILYPVNMDDKDVEVRGTHSRQNQESLALLSKLWNKGSSTCFGQEEFDWQKIIEDNKNELLDESEIAQYEFRKDQLNYALEKEEKDEKGKKRKGRRPE